MERKVDIAIIGAGTAGLSAYREVKRAQKSFVLINDGPYGTTCARVGCMPSKLLIQVANDFHRRRAFTTLGIQGQENLQINIPKALERVRYQRDLFVSGVLKTIAEMGENNLEGFAQFIEPQILSVQKRDGTKEIVKAEKIIIATGSKPVRPSDWQNFSDKILTSDDIFEQKDLPQTMGVMGLGIIGLELGQALSRLGLKVFGFGASEFIGGLNDPKINDYMIKTLNQEMELSLGERPKVRKEGNQLKIKTAKKEFLVDKILASMGRRPNLDGLGLDKIGVQLNEKGLPPFDRATMQIEGFPLFIAGDVNQFRAILHEAADDGRIAGYNATHDQPFSYKRRTPLAITFTEPNIALVGENFKNLENKTIEVGEVSFEDQGRSKVKLKNKGHLCVYGSKKNGRLLGAELAAPDGEHLAHLLSWCIQKEMTVCDILQLPFYHPVIEEGLRTALRNLLRKIEPNFSGPELALCEGLAIDSFN